MDYFVFLLDNMVKIYKYGHICISKLLQHYYIFTIFFGIFLHKIPVNYPQNKTGDILICIVCSFMLLKH